MVFKYFLIATVVLLPLTGCAPAPVKPNKNLSISPTEIAQLKSQLRLQIQKIAEYLRRLQENKPESPHKKYFAFFQMDVNFLETIMLKRRRMHEAYKNQKQTQPFELDPNMEAQLEDFLQELKLMSAFFDVNLSKKSLKQNEDMFNDALIHAQRILYAL